MSEFEIIGGFVAGVVLSAVFVWMVKRQALSIMNSQKAQRGNANKANYEDRLFMAMGELLPLIKAGTPPVEAVKAIAGKYPDVATRLGMKMLKGQMPSGLQDLLGGGEE